MKRLIIQPKAFAGGNNLKSCLQSEADVFAIVLDGSSIGWAGTIEEARQVLKTFKQILKDNKK